MVRLGDIADVKLGKMLDKTKHRTGQRLPYLRNVNVRWGAIETGDLLEMNFEEDQLDRFGLRANDVLVCEGGESGRAAVWNGHLPNLKFQKALHRVRFKVPFDPRLLVYLLELLAKSGGLERRFTGSTIKHFTREAFVQLPVPNPPEPEQRRIVAETEKQLTRVDAGVAALRRVQANLKRYRAAVLKAACEGRLVPTEAELARKERRTFENAADLLSRILEERRRAWLGRGRCWEPGTPEMATRPQLPAGWSYAQLGSLLGHIEAGKSFRCEERPPRHGEVGVAKVSAVTWGRYDEDESKTCLEPNREDDSLLIRESDFLFSRANTLELVGACVIAGRPSRKVMLSDKTLRFCFAVGTQASWVLWYLRSKLGRSEIERLSTGNQLSMRNIGQERIRQIVIPLPPAAEQSRIVAEVERRLSLVEELEATVTANLQRATRLRQAVLQNAFSSPAAMAADRRSNSLCV